MIHVNVTGNKKTFYVRTSILTDKYVYMYIPYVCIQPIHIIPVLINIELPNVENYITGAISAIYIGRVLYTHPTPSPEAKRAHNIIA